MLQIAYSFVITVFYFLNDLAMNCSMDIFIVTHHIFKVDV